MNKPISKKPKIVCSAAPVWGTSRDFLEGQLEKTLRSSNKFEDLYAGKADAKKSKNREVFGPELYDYIGCKKHKFDAFTKRFEKDKNWPRGRIHKGGKRVYSLEDLDDIRDFLFNETQEIQYLRNRVQRFPCSTMAKILISNTKGGVGKSTLAIEFAQYMALRGYRVLIIDADPQSSVTCMLQPADYVDFVYEKTIGAVINGIVDIEDTLTGTYWDNVNMIGNVPEATNLEGYKGLSGDEVPILRLCDELDRLEDMYDVVVIDSAPAATDTIIQSLAACNMLLVPQGTSNLDVHATANLVRTFSDALTESENIRSELGLESPDFGFMRSVMTNQVRNATQNAEASLELIRMVMPSIKEPFYRDSAFTEAMFVEGRTIHEIGPRNEKLKRAYVNLRGIFSEVEDLVMGFWTNQSEKNSILLES